MDRVCVFSIVWIPSDNSFALFLFAQNNHHRSTTSKSLRNCRLTTHIASSIIRMSVSCCPSTLAHIAVQPVDSSLLPVPSHVTIGHVHLLKTTSLLAFAAVNSCESHRFLCPHRSQCCSSRTDSAFPTTSSRQDLPQICHNIVLLCCGISQQCQRTSITRCRCSSTVQLGPLCRDV